MITNQIVNRLTEAAKNAYAPYSCTRIAAILRDEDGMLHVGINVENAAYPEGMCAEASALSQLVTCGKHQVHEVWVYRDADAMVTPCGGCRQKLVEFAAPGCLVHCLNKSHVVKTYKLHDLIPNSFVL